MVKNIEKLKTWLASSGYDGIFLGRRDNFKWITEENENAVVTNTEVGIAFLLIKNDGSITLFADSSDCPRMEAEQNALGASCVLVPWQESLEGYLIRYIEEHSKKENLASDTGINGTTQVQSQLVELRMQLSEMEMKRYRELGQQCAKIVEETTKEIQVGQTEVEVAAIVKARCIEKGISPDCVLVGCDERILNFRHPVPTNKKIRETAMVVLGGEKYGLNISMTRFVSFKEPEREMKDRMKKCQYVFGCMQQIMKQGMTYEAFFAEIQSVYAEMGYPKEWRMHHQGGPTGYGCREFVVTPDTKGILKENQAYAWNPTIQGTKCEETTILHKGSVEMLTRTDSWPRTTVHTPYGDWDVADIFIKTM